MKIYKAFVLTKDYQPFIFFAISHIILIACSMALYWLLVFFTYQ